MKQRELLFYFKEMQDPRVERSRQHTMAALIFISIAAITCGAESWNEIAEFGQAKYKWLRRVVPLPHGIPSHDTFNRFFAALAPGAFEACFGKWAACLVQRRKGMVVNVDGKTMRGSKGLGKTALHMVSAWVGENSVSLGQLRVAEKSNEIKAIPELLQSLFLEDCIVTIDAAGSQTKIARTILEKGAHYVLCVKGNQPSLFKDMGVSFAMKPPLAKWEELDADHGRVETRICSVIEDLGTISAPQRWAGLRTLVRIDSQRYIKATGETQAMTTRYFITSLPPDPQQIARAVRSHWSIENNLHWQLDVSFGEDASRKRNENAAINFSALTKMTLAMLKKDTSTKIGIKSKRLKAGWDNAYLQQILGL